jgi:hypothetical protein
VPLPGVGIILENPSAAPIPTAVAWGTTNLGLSTFAGTSPFYQKPPYGTAVDVPDCYFDIPNVQAFTAPQTYVIPPGIGYISTPTTASMVTALQLQVGSVGTWVTLMSSVAGTASVFFYVSDGVNVRVNVTGANGNVTFYPIRA